MPQLDFSFYISQILWLLIFFGAFFYICKSLILKQLNRISSNRTDLVEKNIKFAQDVTNKAKSISDKCDTILDKNNTLINEKIFALLKQLSSANDEKINNLKKKINKEENEGILLAKQEIQQLYSSIDDRLIEVISSILKKVYLIEPDRAKISELYNNVKNKLSI